MTTPRIAPLTINNSYALKAADYWTFKRLIRAAVYDGRRARIMSDIAFNNRLPAKPLNTLTMA